MYAYPLYLVLMSIIKVQFAVISRIRSIVNAPKSEICQANKIILVQHVIKAMKDDIQKAENLIIRNEFAHLESEVLDSQENISALGIRFTINLN